MAATPCIAQGVPPRHRALAAIARATEACTLASASSAVLSVGRGPCSPFYRAAAREDAVVATETRAAAHTWKQRSSATAAPSGDGSVESTIASAPSCAPATTSALGLDGVLPSTYGTSPHRPQASHGAEHSQKGVSRAQSSQSHEPARAYSTGRPWAAPEAARRGRVPPSGLEGIRERHTRSPPYAVGHGGTTGEQPGPYVRQVRALAWIVTSGSDPVHRPRCATTPSSTRCHCACH